MSSYEPVENVFSPIQLPPPRQKPRLHLGLFAKWIYILITRVLFFVGLSVVSRGLWSTLTRVKSEVTPLMFNRYRALYQNQTLDMVTDRSTVVQPLIGQAQLFDIGVTIWALATEEEEKEWKDSLAQNVTSSTGGPAFPALVGDPALGIHEWFNSAGIPFNSTTYMDHTGLYKIIYSDVAFRQLRLSDISSTTVDFSIPKKYFISKRSGWGDVMSPKSLKAAFTILPSSPSPLDNIKGFSNWIHPDGGTPRRAWPFPLGSEAKANRTIADEALDRLSFVMSLVEMFGAPNPCFNASLTRTPRWTSLPHIVSRTHIRIVKELEIMNFNLFNESHNTLKLHECGKSKPNRQSEFNFKEQFNFKEVISCHRDYHTTGILETLFEMGVILDDGSNRTEWAYAPYLEFSKQGLGPKDYVPVPTQHNCSIPTYSPSVSNPSDNDTNEFPEALNISWKITYSTVSPLERKVLDSLNNLMAPDREAFHAGGNTSDYTRIMAQDIVDQANSLFGIHREESAHPRRRLIFTILSTTLSTIATAFDVLYWYTRSGTAFISVPGTILIALANLIDSEIIVQGRDAWLSYQLLMPVSHDFFASSWMYYSGLRGKKKYSPLRLLQFCFVVFLPLQSIWMSMTALRMVLVWPSGVEDTFLGRNLPIVRRVPPTHRERASDRLERSALQWKSRIAIVVGLFIAYHALLPHIPKLITELHPEPDPSILEAKMLYKNMIMKQSIVDPLFVSGWLFQLILNNSSGSFAGSYKLTAILKVMVLAFETLQFVPWITGLPESRGGVDATFVIYAAVIAVEGWQALTLRRAPIDDDDEKE